jgi:photosystem II stability/assembly factor-like uncharacterized protein
MVRAGTSLLALANGCSVPACVGAIFRSTDGGNAWTMTAQPQDWVIGAWALSDSEILVGGTTLIRSRDGGLTFAKMALPVDTEILSLFGVSANEVYAVGQNGIILHGKR